MRPALWILALSIALGSVGVGCSDDSTSLSAAEEAAPASTSTDVGSRSTPADGDEGWEPYVLGSGGLTGTRSSPDGRSLLLTFVGGGPYVAGEPCTVAYRAEVGEATDEVAVRLFSNSPPSRDDEPFCTAEGYLRSVEVGLESPLGGRPVVEEASQRQLEVFDGSLLAEPTRMPDGWSLRAEQAGYPDPETASYWQRTWGPEPLPPTGDTCTPTDGPMTLTQGPSTGPQRDIGYLEPVSTHDVNGAPATYYQRPDAGVTQVALTWESSGQSFSLDSSPSCSNEGTASLERLLDFARGLMVPAG